MIPLENIVFTCWFCAICFNHRFDRYAYIFCWKNWTISRSSSTSLINGITGTFNNSHSRGILFSIRSSSSCNNQRSAPLPLCDFLLSVDRRWRKFYGHQTKHCNDSFSSGVILRTSQQDGDFKYSLHEFPIFVRTHMNEITQCANWLVDHELNSHKKEKRVR